MEANNKAIRWLQTYIEAHGCHVRKQNHVNAVKLTRSLDEQLMNRPFYWKYMETIGSEGETKTLYYHSDKSQMDDQYMHTDHHLLVRIFRHLRQRQQFFLGYEQIKTAKKQILHPYLFMNTIIRFEGKHVKEEMHSVGINLINGNIVTKMMGKLNELSIGERITPLCYVLAPIISLERAYRLIFETYDHYIQQISHEWALQTFAEQKRYKDILSIESLPPYLKELLTPKITFKTISGGIIYLHPRS